MKIEIQVRRASEGAMKTGTRTAPLSCWLGGAGGCWLSSNPEHEERRDLLVVSGKRRCLGPAEQPEGSWTRRKARRFAQAALAQQPLEWLL